MQTIKITTAFAAILNSIREAGKTPWVIINEDYAVGAYKGRDDARTDKAGRSLAGKIVKADEIEFVTVDLKKPVASIGTSLENEVHSYSCPHCGCDLENGVGEHLADVNGKAIKHVEFEFECLACGGEFGLPISNSKKEKKETSNTFTVTHESTVERPCKLVWSIADEMKAAKPTAKRKEILEVCVSRGIAYYTARTQYQQWLGIQKEMAEREAAQAAKKV